MTDEPAGPAREDAFPRPLHNVEDFARFLAGRFPDAPRGAFAAPADADVLTAWLFLDAGSLPDAQAYQCLAILQFDRVEDRARARVARDCYVLHPAEVAAEAISRAWRERRLYREGLDVSRFLDDRLEEAIEDAVTEGRFGALPGPSPGREFTAAQRRWAAEAIRVCNQAPLEKRRVLHSFLFRNLSPERIAEETGSAAEFVNDTIEDTLSEVHRRAVRAEEEQ